MFIRKTKTGTAKDGSPRLSFRFVENSRVGDKVKQQILLNLGRPFSIEQQYWGLLCQRVEEILSAQHTISISSRWMQTLNPKPGASQSACWNEKVSRPLKIDRHKISRRLM